MPRRSSAKTTGVWEKVPGSGIWWIRYRENGVLHREKVGRKSDALALYQRRKNEIRVGTKLSENMRRPSIRFGQLAEDPGLQRKALPRPRPHRIAPEAKLPDFENRLADQIKPEDIDGWIARNTETGGHSKPLPGIVLSHLPRGPAQRQGDGQPCAAGAAAP